MAPVLFDLRLNKLPEVDFEPLMRPLLICTHQPRIARHVGGEDRGETAGLAHFVSPAAIRTPDRYSSRCSGFRNRLALGTRLGVMARSRAMTSRASSIRPIWA